MKSMAHLLRKILNGEEYRITRFFILVELLGLIASILGFCIHFAYGMKTSGFHTITNEFVAVWMCTAAILVTVVSLHILITPTQYKPVKTTKSTWFFVFFLLVGEISGIITFICYAISNEIPGSLWGLTIILYAFLPLVTLFMEPADGKLTENLLAINESSSELPRPRYHYLKVFLKAIGYLLLFIFTICIALLSYQAINITYDTINYPPPGDMIPIEASDGGSYRIHILCKGHRQSVTYLLEAGGGACSTSFFAIQDALVNNSKRVCVYDRGGYGWSDSAQLPRKSLLRLHEIHKALNETGETGPYVLVGHSVGGQQIQQYVKEYPNEVAALVLLDSYSLDWIKLTAEAYGWSEKQQEDLRQSVENQMQGARSFLTPMGIMRWIIHTNNYHPKRYQYIHNSLYGNNKNWNAQWAEYNDPDPISVDDVTIGSKPVLTISAWHTVGIRSCEDAGVKGTACNATIWMSEQYYRNAMDQSRRLSSNWTMIVCPKPCGHDMVWSEFYTFVVDNILKLGL